MSRKRATRQTVKRRDTARERTYDTHDAHIASVLAETLDDASASTRDALVRALRDIAETRRAAESESLRTGISASTLMRDGRLQDTMATLGQYAPELHQHDTVLMQLESILQRAYATRDALDGSGGKYAGAASSGRPTGSMGQSTNSGYGYAFSRDADRTSAEGVKNARVLRAFADTVAWLRAAINVRKDQVASAELAIGPSDPERKVDKKIEQRLTQLFRQPNRLRQNPAEFWGSVVEDLIVLDRGCIEKVQDVSGRPLELYPLNAAGVQIYPQWDGTDDDAPRYLYVDPDVMAGTSKVPLRNDELVCMMMNAATYRFGLSSVAVLMDEIEADIAAVQAAKKAVSLRPPPHLINLPGYSQQALSALARDVESDFAGKKDLMFIGLDNEKGAQALSLALDPKNSQFLELQVYLARKVCAVLRISPQQVGITFDVNKATGETQQDIAEDTGLVPMLLWIEWYTNREIVSDFAPKKDWRSNLDALNLRTYYPQISEAQRIMHAKEVSGIVSEALGGLPFYTLNMALAAMGEAPVEGGNTFYVDSKNGPIPWLSYDGETGDYQPPSASSPTVGGQDAAGGPSTEQSDDAPDEAQDDESKPAQNAPAAAQNAPSENAPSAPAPTSATSGNESGESGAAPQKAFARAQRHTRAADMRADRRAPGQNWRPSLARAASSSSSSSADSADEHEPYNVTPRGRLSATRARTLAQRPYKHEQARRQLAAEVEALFTNAARTGARQSR